jgi:hypothetical protein
MTEAPESRQSLSQSQKLIFKTLGEGETQESQGKMSTGQHTNHNSNRNSTAGINYEKVTLSKGNFGFMTQAGGNISQ